MINYEIKSQLAKLLATEDLVVEHKNVDTAQFNIETRVLTLPLWKKATNIVYDMLVGHEVGHALFTPNEWDFEVPQQFINVVEDARIEKLMKRKYPGISKTFYYGYRELNDNDFFDIIDEDLTAFNLADRANLYFKVGNFVDLDFYPGEESIITLIERCETFEDTLHASKVLYDYCKHQIKQSDILTNTNIEDKDISPDIKEDDKKFEEDFFDEGGEEEEVSIPDIQPALIEEEPQVLTDTAFTEGSQELNDLLDTVENVYLEIPQVKLENLIASNSEIYNSLEESWDQQLEADFTFADLEYEKFKNSAKKEVSYLVKEFESKKAADSYARSATSRVGVLDCSKLHTYKFNEDIFKKVTILPDGKNHGLIFMLDWSGAMFPIMEDTIKQLYNLVWFCSKVQIPFEVYAFTNNYSQWKYHDQLPLPRMDKEEYKIVVNEDFSLMNLFTSKVSRNVLEKQMKSLWRVILSFNTAVEYTIPGQFMLSGTPLNEALISLHQIIPQFKKENKLQKVQSIILTDGETNPLPYHKMVQRNWEHEPFMGCRKIRPRCSYIRNRQTGCTYQVGYQYWEFTEILLKDLRQTFVDTNFIGIRLLLSKDFKQFIRRYEPSMEEPQMRKIKKERSYAISNSGYHSYFAINSSSLYNDDSFDVDEDASKSKIKSAFSKSLKSKALNKKVLSQFMDLVC